MEEEGVELGLELAVGGEGVLGLGEELGEGGD